MLLVDDARDEREMYAHWFQQQGFCTLQPATADDGFRLAAELNADVTSPTCGLAATRTDCP